jgi:hypothetical protein
MRKNKQTITTAIVAIALLLFIGWRFIQYLGASDEQAGYGEAIPQKAVIEQAEEQRIARLDELAQQGKIAIGMSMVQVKTALGEPARTLVDSSSAPPVTTWWYEHESSREIRFGQDGRVIALK